MLMRSVPADVPLPDVPRHTDDVIFGALDIPVGFDQDRVLINLRAFQRIRAVAGLGTISISAGKPEAEQFDADIDGIDVQGTASLRGIGRRQRNPLSSSRLQFPIPTFTVYGQPDVSILVNNSEIESRVDESEKYPRGMADEKARSIYLNSAVIKGLSTAIRRANIDKDKGMASAFYLAITAGLVAFHPAPEVASIYGVGSNTTCAYLNTYRSIFDNEDSATVFKNYRHSFFAGCTFDRYALSRGILACSTLIKARD